MIQMQTIMVLRIRNHPAPSLALNPAENDEGIIRRHNDDYLELAFRTDMSADAPSDRP